MFNLVQAGGSLAFFAVACSFLAVAMDDDHPAFEGLYAWEPDPEQMPKDRKEKKKRKRNKKEKEKKPTQQERAVLKQRRKERMGKWPGARPPVIERKSTCSTHRYDSYMVDEWPN